MKMKRLISTNTTIFFFLISIITFFSSWNAVNGEETKESVAQLGVVITPENMAQWSGISDRLQATGVKYCVVEFAKLQQSEDLSTVSALLLPNVEAFTGQQAQALADWMSGGGKAIVTGPTGHGSVSQVKQELRSLFGAYWGFSLSSASTLQPLETANNSLSATLLGGAIVPTKAHSTTAAIWISDRREPAVVFTDKSAFFGWRWGFDGVGTVSLDAAWLETALNRYGKFPLADGSPPQYCFDPDRTEPNPLLPSELIENQE